jgi:hypothetical protein
MTVVQESSSRLRTSPARVHDARATDADRGDHPRTHEPGSWGPRPSMPPAPGG